MFKYTVCFAVIVCLLDCSFASSIVKRSVRKESSSSLLKRTGDEEPSSNDIKAVADKIIRDVDSSIRSTAKYAEWVIHAVQELGSNIATDVGTGLMIYILALVLRTDLFFRVGGSRLGLSESNSEQKEEEYRIIAVTVSEIYSKLENMELVDQIITNTSEAAVREFLEQRSRSFSGRPVTYYFYSKLEEVMEETSKLKKEYVELKREVKKRTFAPLDPIIIPKTAGEETKKKFEELLSRKAVVSLILNRIFIQTATKHFSMILSENEFDRYTCARAIFELADKTSLKLEKLQKMYTEAVEKTAGKWNATDSFDMGNELSNIFLPALTEFVEKDATVHAEITALKKKIGTATRFDLSMLKINLLPF